jgi:hypothetical protein
MGEKRSAESFAIGPTTCSYRSRIIPVVLNLSSLEHQGWEAVHPGGHAASQPDPLFSWLWWPLVVPGLVRSTRTGPVPCPGSVGSSPRQAPDRAPRTIVISASAVPCASCAPLPRRRIVSPTISATSIGA